MTPEQLTLLAKLPLTLNASFDTRTVIQGALDLIRTAIAAEAASVFLCESQSDLLTFWALRGGTAERLEGLRMPRDRGIVGWVIRERKPVQIADVKNDRRFFASIDAESGFTTRTMLCVPLIVRGTEIVGALQVLNSQHEQGFTADEFEFVQHIGAQLALAIDNARLVETTETRSQALEKLDQRKSEMLTMISHELRTPLSVIQSAAELLVKGDLSPELRQQMAYTLQNGVTRLTRLSSQVRTLTNVESPHLVVQWQSICPRDLVTDVVKFFANITAGRRIGLTSETGDESFRIRGDRALLTVVLHNLIANAIRFTPDGGKVQLHVSGKNGLIMFAVQDTGIGIAKDELSAIFEKFYEVAPVTQHKSGDYTFLSGGLGLGLNTVRELLELHGARAEVESEVGKGSRFWFELPQQ